jgi:hypothetical protein
MTHGTHAPGCTEQAPIQSGELAELRKLAENAANAKSALDPSWHQFQDAMDAILPATILRLLDALAAVPAAQQQAQPFDGDLRELGHQFNLASMAGTSLVLSHHACARLLAAMTTPPAATPARELTDAEAHKILVAMSEHLQSWANTEGLSECEDDDHPAFAGECIRYLQRHLAAPQGERETEQKQGA